MDVTEPLECHMYKLVSFSTCLPSWRPDRLLLIKPLADIIEGMDVLQFWRGSLAELTIDAEKRRKATEAAARARQRRQDGGAGAQGQSRRRRAGPSAQQAAAKDRRAAEARAHPLLPLPAPSPTDDPDVQWLFEPTSSEASGVEETDGVPAHLRDDSGTDLDTPLINLLRPKAGDKKTTARVSLSDGEQPDWLQSIDQDTDSDTEALPSFNVTPAPPHGADNASEDLPEPGQPASPAGGAEGQDSTSEQDDDLFGDLGEGALEAKRARGPAFPRADDLSHRQPAGCICKKYEPLGKTPYWFGQLPEGVTDTAGRRTRQRSFHPGLRSDSEALALVEAWLNIHASGEEEAAHSDTDSQSSTDSSSSSSSS